MAYKELDHEPSDDEMKNMEQDLLKDMYQGISKH